MTPSVSGGLEPLLPIAPVAASFLVYAAVIGNGFFYDDFIRIWHGGQHNLSPVSALFVILHGENNFNGVSVRFVERDADNLRKAVEVAGSRMPELLVANRSGRSSKNPLRESRP
jgi:hypothetical protein